MDMIGGVEVTLRQRRMAENLGIIYTEELIWTVATPDDEFEGMTEEEFFNREAEERSAE